ncbi:MAG: hypothetical protein ACT4ON_09465 [Bacteroidota bacterium]
MQAWDRNPTDNKMTNKHKLILFLIASDPGVKSLYKLIQLFDRCCFPSDMTANLQYLLDNNLIRPSKWFEKPYKVEPSEFEVTDEGKNYLDKNYVDQEIVDYLKSCSTPGILLEITQAYISKKGEIKK